LWHIFAAHRCNEVKKLAPELKIELEFSPPGMSGHCQPLDPRVFGSLKARARSRFGRFCIDQNGGPTMQDPVVMMDDAWKSISQDEILDAWDLQPEQNHCYWFSCNDRRKK
jgi:hypothetical protein